jgi:hypothetical protein
VIKKLVVLILLYSSLLAVCIYCQTTVPSYQEEQDQTLTRQYFLASALLGHSQPASANIVPANISNLSTYQNHSLGIGLQYPSNWKVEERTNMNNNNTASSIKFSSPSNKDLMVVSVYTQNLSSLPIEQQQQNTTLDSLTRTGINAAKENLNNLQFLDLETANVTLGLGQNNLAHKIIYSNTNKNASFPLQFVTMQTYTIKDGHCSL